jgi:predicted ATPase
VLLTLAISGYRSLRNVVLPLGRINVVTGENGSGKSSLYKAIRLLASTAQGDALSTLALEGGLQSTLWAGPETISAAMKRGEQPIQGTTRKKTVSLKLGFASEDYGYQVDFGLPTPGGSMFARDPEIKSEVVWVGEVLRRGTTLSSRRGPSVQTLAENNAMHTIQSNLATFDSMMTHAANPQSTPEMLELRERMRAWRFYDHFRTDREAPARMPQVGTRTPILSNDGSDLAAAVQTIAEIGDARALAEAIDDAFPGHRLEIQENNGYFETVLYQHGLLRPLRASELSDGTLRYLLLVAALLTPRPPSLMILNEPETSLHKDLVAPLARLIQKVCETTQIIVVSHDNELVDLLSGVGALQIQLKKELGETTVFGVEAPSWVWQSR